MLARSHAPAALRGRSGYAYASASSSSPHSRSGAAGGTDGLGRCTGNRRRMAAVCMAPSGTVRSGKATTLDTRVCTNHHVRLGRLR